MIASSQRIALTPPDRIDAALTVPGSKSLTNRALLVAALADGESHLEGVLEADDAEVMTLALRRLGAEIEPDGAATTVRVRGRGGRWRDGPLELDVGLSGTAVRFLVAAVALGRGRYRLDGTARMRERPIEDQLAALRGLGVRVSSERGNGCPPVVVEAEGIAGGRAVVAGDRSSQYLSALLMSAPYARGPVEVEVSGELQSKPFVDMTLSVMRAFGVDVERQGYERFVVERARYAPRRFVVEGDAMAAGYFWAAAAVSGGRVVTHGVGHRSVQGDAAFTDVLELLGCRVVRSESSIAVEGPEGGMLRGGRFDLNDLPDQAQTLAVLALFADGPVSIDNVPNLRIKETDRLHALATELRRFGASVEERHDGLTIVPALSAPARVEVETYGDHRMAMAFAIAGVRRHGVSIKEPDCVAKTYPGFFDDLARIGVGVERS
ncbi:MAG: 3-phosphoshikimate 1-carboxyvinyltransferase [Trueperaceae bacterium]|nr:3-phosphoshikimate 1-carboxyvinyltransferase [Trueperaceae bacterium]